jgi:hypothetical protein
MDRNAYGAAAMLCSRDCYLSQLKEIVIVGSRGGAATESVIAAVHQRCVPNKVLFLVDEGSHGREAEWPLAAGKSSVNGRPTASVCHGSSVRNRLRGASNWGYCCRYR